MSNPTPASPDGLAGACHREPFHQAELRAALVDTGISPAVTVVEETGSTNTDLAAQIAGHGKDGSAFEILLAEYQTGGKGRMGRTFTAPPHAQIIMSMAIIPRPEDLPRAGTLSLAAGLAVVDAISASDPENNAPPATLKWPNDVLMDGKKMCGILAEGVDFGTDQPAIVMGIGVNLSLKQGDLPVPHASSLYLQGISVDRTTFAIRLATALKDRVEQWRDRPEDMLADYRVACSTLGEEVRVHLPGDIIVEGTATGVNSEGHILVDTSDGQQEYAVGDVVHLRLASQWRY